MRGIVHEVLAFVSGEIGAPDKQFGVPEADGTSDYSERTKRSSAASDRSG